MYECSQTKGNVRPTKLAHTKLGGSASRSRRWGLSDEDRGLVVLAEVALGRGQRKRGEYLILEALRIAQLGPLVEQLGEPTTRDGRQVDVVRRQEHPAHEIAVESLEHDSSK